MVRVDLGLAWKAATHTGLTPPSRPACEYPELRPLLPGKPPPSGTPNAACAAPGAALVGLGLDQASQGTPGWNLLRDLDRPGGPVVLKPNSSRHSNPPKDEEQSVENVITHGAPIRAVADLALLATGAEGETPAFAIRERVLLEIGCERPFRHHDGWGGLMEGARDA